MPNQNPNRARSRTRLEIERLTRRLLKQAGIVSPPVDLQRIAAEHGVRVQRADLGPDCSGVLVRQGSAAVIGVQWSHRPNRQRFSLAHELGHFFLHPPGEYIDRGTHVRFRDKDSGTGSVQEEREANLFAASILLPEAWLRASAAAHPFDPADETALHNLAEQFAVSMQTLTIRLSTLGIFRDLLPEDPSAA